MGLIWFDAHSNFTTPEISTTGFLDGMGVSMITGRAWRPLTAAIPGYRPLADDRLVFVGLRDLDELDYARMESLKITNVKWEEIRALGVEQVM